MKGSHRKKPKQKDDTLGFRFNSQTSVDFSSSHRARFKDDADRPNTAPYYYRFESDSDHWRRQKASFARDSLAAGRQDKTAWWDHAQSIHYTKAVDKLYETTHSDLSVAVESSPIRYKSIQTPHKRYPQDVTDLAKKISMLGPGQYNHKAASSINEYEPPRVRVGFGSTTSRKKVPVGFKCTTQRSLYKGWSLTSSVSDNYDLRRESMTWQRNPRSIAGARRNSKLHIRIRPLLTNLSESAAPAPVRREPREVIASEDEDEFGDPFEWLYAQPNGEQRVKNAMATIYEAETSLRQTIRSRKRAALWKPKPSMETVQREAAEKEAKMAALVAANLAAAKEAAEAKVAKEEAVAAAAKAALEAEAAAATEADKQLQ